MNKLFTLLLTIIFASNIFANGVGIIDAQTPSYLKLVSGKIEVKVEEQVAVIKSTQIFKNTTDNEVSKFRFAFPIPVNASATSLRYSKDNIWYDAVITPISSDTSYTGEGSKIDKKLKSYLGNSPVYFDANIRLSSQDEITFEVSYVELLNYEDGKVTFDYPNDYSNIQSDYLIKQEINFEVNSGRTIEDFTSLNHECDDVSLTANKLSASLIIYEDYADKDYSFSYTLNRNELGLFGYSSWLPDDQYTSEGNRGFFSFVVEPDPSEQAQIIGKEISLVLDCSGSMRGDKLTQAKNAANYIIDNLNTEDSFNIIDFSTNITSFERKLVPVSQTAKDSAKNYIASLMPEGGTDINKALLTALDQYAISDPKKADVVVFLTDGEPTIGETETDKIIDNFKSKFNSLSYDIRLFTFGIGENINQGLLTGLSNVTNGLSYFIDENDIETEVQKFYRQIKNPVLLNTKLEFTPNIVKEVYPSPLQNLYQGQQMIVTGRYSQRGDVSVKFTGQATDNNSVEYKYQLNLSDKVDSSKSFLPKLWAKRKIENLMIKYRLADLNSYEEGRLKAEIKSLSIAFGIITEFTSYQGGAVGVEEDFLADGRNEIPNEFIIIGNYPNPFNPSTKIKFSVGKIRNNVATVRIFNSIGELVKTLYMSVSSNGIFELMWDGTNNSGNQVPSDVYVYSIDIDNSLMSGKMVLLK